MADNAYFSLKNYQTTRIPDAKGFAMNAGAGHSGGGVLQYPLGLGGGGSPNQNWNSSTALKIMPFTLFMPYKRSASITSPLSGALSTLQGNELYTMMPSPDYAIALPTPQSALKTTYGVDYAPVDVGALVGSMATNEKESLAAGATAIAGGLIGAYFGGRTGAVVGATVGATAGSAATGGNLLGPAALNAGQAALSIIGQNPEIAQVLSRRQENPFTENVFKNVQFREHSFSYVFMPRNDKESQTIDQIISLFKYIMLPRPTSGGILFEFPYEFQIVHSIQNTTFTLLPSVLQSMTVDFGGGTDSLKLFVEKQGKNYPAKITLEMTFKEMVLLNRDRVQNTDFDIKDDTAPSDVLRFRF